MKWQSGFDKDGRQAHIELSDQDMLEHYVAIGKDPEDWGKLGLSKKYAQMSTLADILMVGYLKTEGILSEEYAAQRHRELSKKLREAL